MDMWRWEGDYKTAKNGEAQRACLNTEKKGEEERERLKTQAGKKIIDTAESSFHTELKPHLWKAFLGMHNPLWKVLLMLTEAPCALLFADFVL